MTVAKSDNDPLHAAATAPTLAGAVLPGHGVTRSLLPSFLQNHPNLVAHFDEHLEARTSKEKGDTFLAVSLKIIPLTEIGRQFSEITVSEKQTHDDGIDLISATNERGDKLLCQSKYKIHRKDDIDNIISKFRHYESKKQAHKKGLLFNFDGDETYNFLIVTLSDVKEIIKQYEKSELASKEYYHRLIREGRLDIFHGPDLLLLLRNHYSRAHALPAEFTISSESGWLHTGNSYLGILKANELKSLYERFGEALFFENIRDFLGFDSQSEEKSNVNEDISRTIREQPGRMLERNNGITLRAAEVTQESGQKLKLANASIVNGCQTTMCIALCRTVSDDCYIAAKIVVTGDAWEITKTANAQNSIRKIELELAKFLRPQLLRRATSDLGYSFKEGESASAKLIINSIYQNQVDYEEIRFLYLGLFSKGPGNIFEYHFADIRYDVLEALISSDEAEEKIFSTMFLMTTKTREAINLCRSHISGTKFNNLFKRFFDQDKSSYRIYFTILAVCGITDQDISNRSGNTAIECDRMSKLLKDIRAILENSPQLYYGVYQEVFLQMADSTIEFESDQEILKSMHSIVKRAFKINLQKLQLRLQMKNILAKEKTSGEDDNSSI